MSQIHLEGSWIIRAPSEAVYNTITDFERVPEYFPSVAKAARIVEQDGNNLIVEVQTKAFHVRMEAQLRPPEGFLSTNTSSLGVEHESFLMEEVSEGTRIHYVNDVEIKSPIFRLFGRLLIGKVALWYWERAVIGKMRRMLGRIIPQDFSAADMFSDKEKLRPYCDVLMEIRDLEGKALPLLD